jgi:hypothetical protein
MPAMGAGLKGIFTGGSLGGVQVGGLNNLFTGIGKGLTGNFSQASNYFKLSQVGNVEQLLNTTSKDKSFASYFGNQIDTSNALKAPIVDTYSNLLNSNQIEDVPLNAVPKIDNFGPKLPIKLDSVPRLATGGSVKDDAGVDRVPTLLSGGEFVVNRAAAQNIGTSNLQSLNAGTATVVGGGSNSNNNEIISKLNELIEVTKSKENVMVNVSAGAEAGGQNSNSTGQGQQYSASNTQKMLNKKIRDAVIQILENEKRLGGSLRR